MQDERYEEIRAVAFERIEAMILTLDASQLLDHLDDGPSVRRGVAMFNAIVERMERARAELDAALQRPMVVSHG